MKPVSILLLAGLSAFGSLHAQNDSVKSVIRDSTESTQWMFAPRFRAVTGHIAMLITIYSFGAQADFDLHRDVSTNRGGFGLRLGVEKIGGGDFGGSKWGPYLQSTLLGRATSVFGEWCSGDIYGGVSYSASQVAGTNSPGLGVLFGMDVRLGPERASAFGLLLKLCWGSSMQKIPLWGGIGFFGGWSQ